MTDVTAVSVNMSYTGPRAYGLGAPLERRPLENGFLAEVWVDGRGQRRLSVR